MITITVEKDGESIFRVFDDETESFDGVVEDMLETLNEAE